jgi:UDP-N-acetyl-2-amino-2-deoxyglucuronate dehydrogenase
MNGTLTPASKQRVALIGLGMAVTPHARALRDLSDRVEVIHAYSPTAARREAFGRDFDFPLTGQLETILEDRSVEAVLILTPPNTHLDLVSRCAAAGKHILLEKPVEITTARAEALVAATRAAGVRLGIVLQNRYRPACLALKWALDDRRLGRLVGVSAATNNWRPQSYYDQPGRGTRARDGGGVLLTQAIHTLDLMISFAGAPQEVAGFATTSPVHRMETEDIAVAAIRYANGAIGTVSATTCAFPGLPERIELIGEAGVAVLDGTVLKIEFHSGEVLEAGDAAANGGGTGADPMAFPHAYHQALISDFLDAIRDGRDPWISGEEALKVHRFIDALLASNGRSAAIQ